MPDIRNFFGGRGSQPVSSQEKAAKKKTGKRKVIEDSDDDEIPSKNNVSDKKGSPPKRHKAEAKVEETTTSDYFQSSAKAKPHRSTPTKTRSPATKKDAPPPAETTRTPRSTKANGDATAHSGGTRSSARKKKPTSYREPENDNDVFVDDDISTAKQEKGSKDRDNDYEEKDIPDIEMNDVDDDDDFEDFDPEVSGKLTAKQNANGRKAPKPKTAAPAKAANGKKVKDEADSAAESTPQKGESAAKKGPKTQPPIKKTPVKKDKKAAVVEKSQGSKEVDAILADIPTVRAPSPPPKTGETAKPKFYNQAQRSAPAAAGSKEMPEGQENCLAGLSFVFTGILDSLGREEGQALVKKYGGHVMSAPSKKTSYVVLGKEAGPKKLETIQKLDLKSINEDGLFELIRRMPPNGGDGEAAAKYEEKKQKEEQKVREMAAEMEREERSRGKIQAARGSQPGKAVNGDSKGGAPQAIDSRLWTVKYAPTQVKQMCGNKGQMEKLQAWLREWPNNLRLNFKKAGKDGTFNFRAMILHGPPGIGKTTAAHLAAQLEGYDVLESNASDARSKNLVESGLRGVLDNVSLRGYFAADGKSVEAGKKKLVLIMDEVDGMSAGDRGGVGALTAAVRKTHVPIILICNERRSPKMRPFDGVTYDLPFRRPTTADIRARVATICYREGFRLPPNVIDALIEGTHADIRQIINMLSQYRVDPDQREMSFDDGKAMSKAWEKNIILKPWDITHKLFSSGMFAANSHKTLTDKMEMYFADHETSYLMVQENYIRSRPTIANNYGGKEHRLKVLELMDKAAESISDGDMVDRMIHGSQQQWSLMPTHAIFSTVRPASFAYGALSGQPAFTSWLGNNSKQGKLMRFVKEIQGHMRLRASGDRHEVRQQYLPALWARLVNKLEVEGKEAVPEVIDIMDHYYLNKDDFDAIVELGVGPMDMERVKIPTQAKATFTRLYNQQSHPLSFMKASSVQAPRKAAKDKPDLEEAIEESDEDEVIDAEKNANEGESEGEEGEDVDLSKDKYVKQPKKKRAPKKSNNGNNEKDDGGSSEEDQPTRGKSKGTKGKAGAKKGARGKK
ncbi:MAG: hypothetical protein M1838_002431 [Thelocarpon superellum]|nr:MAG: hypothetical protein M1838_002431 [Thelocarpon superellum]